MRRASWWAAGGLTVAAGAATAAALASDPKLRADVRRATKFARPLDRHDVVAPNPPPLPPGRTLVVSGRGEFFVRDSATDGPAVMLLHGWGATADVNFFTVYGPLAAHHRVIAMDLRGHGRGLRSSAPFRLEDCADDAAAVLEVLSVERAVVVGYSMGGPIALEFARRHRDRCAGLVLEATALEFRAEPRERAMWRALEVAEGILLRTNGDSVVERMLREAIERRPELAEHRAWLTGEMWRNHVKGIVGAGSALAAFDARPWAGQLQAPAAVVLTTDDQLVAPAKQRALADTLHAAVLEIQGDHDVCITDPDRFAAITGAAVDHVARRAGLAARPVRSA